MNLVEIKKIVGRIKNNLFKNSNSYSIGMLKSHFKGTGLNFKEHQVYAYGDDVRFIDWKMLAKMSQPFIKTFEEDRNVEIVVVVDASPTMFSGHEGVSKLQASIEICCLLYLLSKETGDSVQCVIMADEITYVPRKTGTGGIALLIAALERKGILLSDGRVNLAFEHSKIMDEDEKLVSVMKHFKRKKELVFLSDFNDFFSIDSLKKMLSKGHVHCFHMISPLDEANETPYSIFSKDTFSSNKAKLRTIDFGGSKQKLSTLGKKFKTLKVHGRYLEDFVKEMM